MVGWSENKNYGKIDEKKSNSDLIIGLRGISTSEWARVAHPDRISRELGELLYLELFEEDPFTKADIKVIVGPDDDKDQLLVHFSGQVTSSAELPDISGLTQEFLNEVGYGDYDLRVINSISAQSATLRSNHGAGDSRAIYGYYHRNLVDPNSGLCLSHWLAREISRRLDGYPNLRDYEFDWLLPDGKVQVTSSDNEVYFINICAQHTEDIDPEKIREVISTEIIDPIFDECKKAGVRCENCDITVNSAGPFTDGASNADTAIGNKDGNIVLGGGCPQTDLEFYGRDFYKPDKTITLWLRYVSRVTANHFAVSSVIAHTPTILGRDRIRIFADAPGVGEKELKEFLEGYELTISEIIAELGLYGVKRELYRKSAIWGPYGADFPWDQAI